MIRIFFGALFSYLVGAIPTAFIFAKIMKNVDIRDYGSGNVGATNTLRVLGRLPAAFVLFLDVFKGIIAVVLFGRLFMPFFNQPPAVSLEFVRALFGICVVLGHVFNIFLKFKGGKGVATSMGVLIAIAPKAALFGLLVFVAVVIFTRYVSLGSIIAGILIPFYNHFTKQNYCAVILSAILCIIVVATHRSNIKRLIAGRERRVFEKK